MANRGEIARRVAGAARDLGMATVAVFSDADAGEPFVGEADEAVRLPGVRAADTYLDIDRLVDAAGRTGADALHPGYGFLAESAELAEACARAGIVFVGPPPAAMRAMARKIEAKELAASIGVPVLPTVPLEAVREVSAGADAIDGVRFPLLVKASAGGGGTGIHLVQRAEDLAETLPAARREALGAFGDGALFLEPYLERPHHVEVQVLADAHGHVVHLFERECSVQRRHQKVVEEAPSPNVGTALRERMCTAAVSLARAVGYEGVGTVEFLVDGDECYFLEMNTRLQVEHRVTEAVTGVDLVRAQLLVADGRPLDWGQDAVAISGWALEVRLYAEDPASGFLPTSGRVDHYSHDDAPGVLFDDGIASGSVVSAHYDGLLAKIVAHGATRVDAAARLGRAVRTMRLDGVRTNRRLLAAILADEEFLDGAIDTAFLERHPELATAALDEEVSAAHAVAAAHARSLRAHAASPLRFAPLGWRSQGPATTPFRLRDRADGRVMTVALRVGDAGTVAEVDDRTYEVVLAGSGGEIDVTLDGVRRRCEVRRHGAPGGRGDQVERWEVNSASGQSELEVTATGGGSATDAAHGEVVTPVPGNVARVLVSEGASVSAGDVLVVVEAMKMEHRVVAPAGGVVASVAVTQGDAVEAHQLLAVVAPVADGPS